MGMVKIEGKEVALDDTIIKAGIPAIKAALSVDFPDVENADVQIVSPTKAGAPRTATVVKRGTGKGDLSLRGSRSLPPTRNQSVVEHVAHQAAESTAELFRRLDILPMQQSVVLDLARTKCACGSNEPHPDQYWLVVVGGPFSSPENALDGLTEALEQRDQILAHNRGLTRLKSRDITGAEG